MSLNKMALMVSSRMLKNTAAFIAPSITKLFNQSIKSGRIPSEWKSSYVVPISKGGRYTLDVRVIIALSRSYL